MDEDEPDELDALEGFDLPDEGPLIGPAIPSLLDLEWDE